MAQWSGTAIFSKFVIYYGVPTNFVSEWGERRHRSLYCWQGQRSMRSDCRTRVVWAAFREIIVRTLTWDKNVISRWASPFKDEVGALDGTKNFAHAQAFLQKNGTSPIIFPLSIPFSSKFFANQGTTIGHLWDICGLSVTARFHVS